MVESQRRRALGRARPALSGAKCLVRLAMPALIFVFAANNLYPYHLQPFAGIENEGGMVFPLANSQIDGRKNKEANKDLGRSPVPEVVSGGLGISPEENLGHGSSGERSTRWKDVSNYRPTSYILSDSTLPSWIGDYASFHARQRRRYLVAKRRQTSTSNNGNGTTVPFDDASDVKFLISHCLKRQTCGGASDRLQDMPYNLLLANRTNRVLLVIWDKPARLEHYLVPPPGGIDWTIDNRLRDFLGTEGSWNLNGNESDVEKKIVSTTRRFAVPKFREYENEEYPMSGIKEHTFTFEEHKSKIVRWATNAVNCAVELHPNSTIYVSSDNNDTVGYLLEESRFAQHYIDATTHKKHPLPIRLVARGYSDENHHLEFSNKTEGESFMGVFEDLTIMGMGRCVAHGVGGYGRLGAALSGGGCVVAHRGPNSRVCSDALARM
ncbi:hypothetical protein ACHAWF_007737 [Thalassiosira exigua]